MGKTMSEKILARAAGLDEVKAGDIVWVNVDVAMMDDILGPRVQIAEKMKQLQASVWNPDKVVIISDHYTPPATIQQADIVKFTRDWAKEYGIKYYYEFLGPCHQVMMEKGHIVPGAVVMGTDSHTCMGGAVGAFSTGVGSTEMLGILATGKTWLRVPETIQAVWTGILLNGVMAKDISLRTIKEIGHAGATYKAVEYVGETIRNLSIDERLCITNMAVEMGAKAGLMEPDETVQAYYDAHDIDCVVKPLSSDEDAMFCQTYLFDAEKLTPQVACPHEVDNVSDVTDVGKQKIQQAYLGSCTGGRYHDLAVAAQILKGKKISRNLRMLVSPASQHIWKQAERDGLLAILAEAGATILAPTCGACLGVHSGILGEGEYCISSTNRNFLGRMGSKKSGVFLASPATVAASAITGYITDPRVFL
ncbi:3-isopropylmalate dehydratase large subunit [Megasphaera stantonii]|uniref:3-isopropylmalate dehydratase large subunit n=1 Tax=Megasphaera stantonii TaxID=2144175 RepID=UPI0023EFA2BE|nr:3-isopropylmalate dehydratase large subunit [Megasphaera stantonii]